jgi:hypothetical protein
VVGDDIASRWNWCRFANRNAHSDSRGRLADRGHTRSVARRTRRANRWPLPGHAIALLNASEVINFALVDMNLRDCFSDELIHNLNDRNIPFAIITAYHALPTNCGDRAVATLLKPVDHRKLFKLLSLYARGSTAV